MVAETVVPADALRTMATARSSAGGLHHALGLGERFQLACFETGTKLAIDYRDRRWHGTVLTHHIFHGLCRFQIGRVRHAMGDDGRF